MEALSMWPILGYNWFELVTPQLLACRDVTEDMICKPAKVSLPIGFLVGFT
jgi:hypothetical protein